MGEGGQQAHARPPTEPNPPKLHRAVWCRRAHCAGHRLLGLDLGLGSGLTQTKPSLTPACLLRKMSWLAMGSTDLCASAGQRLNFDRVAMRQCLCLAW